MEEEKEKVKAGIDSETLTINIYYQTDKEFHDNAKWLDNIWYGKWIRGYVKLKEREIYINKDAWYKDENDLKRLILHEVGHILGMKHTKIPGGIMFFSGLLRW